MVVKYIDEHKPWKIYKIGDNYSTENDNFGLIKNQNPWI